MSYHLGQVTDSISMVFRKHRVKFVFTSKFFWCFKIAHLLPVWSSGAAYIGETAHSVQTYSSVKWKVNLMERQIFAGRENCWTFSIYSDLDCPLPLCGTLFWSISSALRGPFAWIPIHDQLNQLAKLTCNSSRGGGIGHLVRVSARAWFTSSVTVPLLLSWIILISLLVNRCDIFPDFFYDTIQLRTIYFLYS